MTNTKQKQQIKCDIDQSWHNCKTMPNKKNIFEIVCLFVPNLSLSLSYLLSPTHD
jgi:hypothetical protein